VQMCSSTLCTSQQDVEACGFFSVCRNLLGQLNNTKRLHRDTLFETPKWHHQTKNGDRFRDWEKKTNQILTYATCKMDDISAKTLTTTFVELYDGTGQWHVWHKRSMRWRDERTT
jgi:hypothetical protein